MFTKIGAIGVGVSDQDKALDKTGFTGYVLNTDNIEETCGELYSGQYI